MLILSFVVQNPAGAGSGGDATGSDDAAGLVVLEDEKAWLASLLTAIEGARLFASFV